MFIGFVLATSYAMQLSENCDVDSWSIWLDWTTYVSEHTKDEWFSGLVGLVGKEPDVVRGLLVDTGAAINVHSASWRKAYEQGVLRPNGLWISESSSSAQITGVEGNAMSTSKCHTVPGGLKGRLPDGTPVHVSVTFSSQEMRGNAPALLSLSSLLDVQDVVNCGDHTLTMTLRGQRVIFDLILTRSRHYILPLDSFHENKKYGPGEEEMVLYSEAERSEMCLLNSTDGEKESMTKTYGKNDAEENEEDNVEDETVDDRGNRPVATESIDHDDGLVALSEADKCYYGLSTYSAARAYDESSFIYLSERRCCAENYDGVKIPWPMTSMPVPDWDFEDTTKWDFWEIVAYDGKLTQEARKAGLACGPVVDRTLEWDLNNPRHQAAIYALIDLHHPSLIYLTVDRRSWECTPKADTSIREWMQRYEAQAHSFHVQVARRQKQDGADFVVEDALDSEDWREPSGAELIALSWRGELQIADMCRFGLKDPESGLPHRRSRGMAASFPLWRTSKLCDGHGGLMHSWLRGRLGPRYGNRQKSTFAVNRPQEFCRRVIDDFKRCKESNVWSVEQRHPGHNQSRRGRSSTPTRSRARRRSRTASASARHNVHWTCDKCRGFERNTTINRAHTYEEGCMLKGRKGITGGEVAKFLKEYREKQKKNKSTATSSKQSNEPTYAGVKRKRRLQQAPDVVVTPNASSGSSSSSSSSSSSAARPVKDEPVQERESAADAGTQADELPEKQKHQRHPVSLEPKVSSVRAGIGELVPDKNLLLELAKWSDLEDLIGMTRFANFNIGRESTSDEKVSEDLEKKMKALWDKDDLFEWVYAQVARSPLGRREAAPHCGEADAPWRKSIILQSDGGCRVEDWTKVFGHGAIARPTERFRVITVDWAVFVFARQKPTPGVHDASVQESLEEPEEQKPADGDDLPAGAWSAPDLAPNLGRLTKLLISNNSNTRMKGLNILHRRYWHAKKHELKRYLEKAGLELPDAELQKVVDLCKICRMWKMPVGVAKTRTTLPTRANKEVEFDFMFYKAEPVGVHVDRADRFGLVTIVASRETEDCITCQLTWINVFGPMEFLFCDQEGAIAGVEFGIWCSRTGIQRKLVGTDVHLKLVERHIGLLRNTMHHLEAEAKFQGLTLSTRELAMESNAAKNTSLDYGGFTPAQGRLGNNPDGWSRASTEGYLEEGVFGNAFFKRTLALRAIQQAIWEARMQEAARGKERVVNRNDFPVGTKIEVYEIPKRKNYSGWQGPCVVVRNSPEAISYEHQGVIKMTEPRKCRLALINLVVYWFREGDSEPVELFRVEEMLILMKRCESLMNGSFQVHGTLVHHGEEVLSQHAVDGQLEVLKLAKEICLFRLGLPYCAGVVMWHGKRNIPSVSFGGNGVAVTWPTHHREKYETFTVDSSYAWSVNRLTQSNDWQNRCGLLFYSFMALMDEEKAIQKYYDAEEPPDDDFQDPMEYLSVQPPEQEALEAPQPPQPPSGLVQPGRRGRPSVAAAAACPPRRYRPRSRTPMTPRASQTDERMPTEMAGTQTFQPRASQSTQAGVQNANISTQAGVQSSTISTQAGVQSTSISTQSGVSSATTATQANISTSQSVGGSQHHAAVVGGYAGAQAGSAVGTMMGGPLGGLVGDVVGSAVGSSAGQALGAVAPVSPMVVEPPAPFLGDDGQLYLPGLDLPVTAEEAEDPGQLEVSISGGVCETMHVAPEQRIKGLRVWVRNTEKSRQYRTTTADGPSWDSVRYRSTYDADPGEILESMIDVKQLDDVRAKLDKTRNLITELFYSPDKSEEDEENDVEVYYENFFDDRGFKGVNNAEDQMKENPKIGTQKFVADPMDADSFIKRFFDDETEHLQEELHRLQEDVRLGCYYTHLVDSSVFKVDDMNRELTKEEQKKHKSMCDVARKSEVASLMEHKSMVPVEKAKVIHCGKPMTSRLVYTWKLKDGKWTVKCRYCIRGFLDPQINSLIASAATASAISHRLVCSYAVNHLMKVVSLDVSTAFLQGLTFSELNERGQETARHAYADTPPGLMDEMYSWFPELFEGVAHLLEMAVTMELKKGVYGLKDAPRLWREEVHKFLTGLGMTQSRYCECTYFRKLFKGAKANRLIVAVHVDDFECTGKDADLKWFEGEVTARFGAPKKQQWSFRHCGVDYEQSKERDVITHSQVEFVEKIPFMKVTKERRKNLDSPLTAEEWSGFRSILGGGQWAARTRGDAIAEVNRLQSKTAAPTVRDLVDANIMLRKMKDTAKESYVSFKRQPAGPKKLLIFADASFNDAKSVKSKATAGWIAMLVSDAELTMDLENAHLLNWPCKRFSRVAKSTLSAEAIAQATAAEDAIRLSGFLEELYGVEKTTREFILMQDTGFSTPVDMVTDCRSLYEVLISPMEPRPTDSSATLWLRWLRESYARKSLQRSIWCATGDMKADGFTKPMENSDMRELFRTGRLRTRYAVISGGGIIDSWKGRPPTKKEREEESSVVALLDAFYHAQFF